LLPGVALVAWPLRWQPLDHTLIIQLKVSAALIPIGFLATDK
jgi:hypothetical protein